MTIPNASHRVCITGRTGSGKSQFAIAFLSTRNFDRMPYIFIDYKGEPLFQEIMEECDGIKEIGVDDKPPKQAGLYYMHPRPQFDDEAIDKFLYQVYVNGKTGLQVDEGYCLPQSRKNMFDVLLTQGRTKLIPITVLYQRPAWMSRFAVAQADFHAYFEQSDERDAITARAFIKPLKDKEKGITIDTLSPLPKYHCLWHDVGEGRTSLLAPAPSRDTILSTFKKRLQRRAEKALV